MSPSRKDRPASSNLTTGDNQLELRSFDQSLPMNLLRAREAVMKQFIPTLQEHALSPQQWRTIRVLQQENGLEISEVAKRTHLLLPSLSRIIQNLESRELIERRSVENDQRRKALFLTKDGRQVFKQITPKSAQRYERIAELFGQEKLDQLDELLHQLIESIDHA